MTMTVLLFIIKSNISVYFSTLIAKRKYPEFNSRKGMKKGNSMANLDSTNRCPRCGGKMYADHNYQDEAYCMTCGYVEYFENISSGFLENSFEEDELFERDFVYETCEVASYRSSSYPEI